MNKLRAQLDWQLAPSCWDGVDASSHPISRFDQDYAEASFRHSSGSRQSRNPCSNHDHILHCSFQVRVSARGPRAGTG
jgi:hypothetical protein